MAIEIERKFIVTGNFRPYVAQTYRIKQGYICREPGKSVRIRICGDKAWLTIKGASADNGLSRYEFEKQLTITEANELFRLCEPRMIEKERHIIPAGQHTWEVDVFHGSNEGLILAEIELSSGDEVFILPEWAGKEVTGDRRYYNSMLTQFPYETWGKDA